MKTNRHAIKRAILGVHKLGIRFGIHILPVHYYSPVPDILELQRTRDVWARKSVLPGVSVNLDAQAANLQFICLAYQSEYAGNKFYKEAVSNHFGPGYGYIEAQALHSFIRHYKPKRIVEVGSGVSTYCMLKASEINAKETGQTSKIVSIEPYPSSKLRTLPGIELITHKVQNVPFEVFTKLGENDLLFIDSSHTVKAGSDVNYLILEVLPRLRKGVIVHFHDIYLPYDYQRNVSRTFLHWAETSLLRAFLIFNEKVKIIACLSHLHYERQDVLREVFPEYNPQADVNGLSSEKYKPFDQIPKHFPSSTYLQIQQ
jgi:predicted O-methyltransferase YrrM